MSRSPSPGADDEALLDGVGPALAAMRASATDTRRVLRNQVLNVIAEAPGEITVGGVAEAMGVFQPVASRTIAACVEGGLVRRTASQADGRQSLLVLTEEGEAERRRLAAGQRRAFEEITETWDRADRLQFARYLIQYNRDGGEWVRRQRREQRDGSGGQEQD
ncbi:winged helix-turn-helix transcriptional regulator [Catenulispora sp. NL8]|uniref:Winged helix-turn-helix transcriptional regulator n=1 Tax=Catenulispora pinistramenti TaxID=2705254 RepID=A0ABS5L5B0_9ACTN|nr:MarR family winged helix-turn-helix transcriptional regulator [Catenulispora pinistramenti]MBS2553535.1 winged helix-turn-helix transcriptional regulator [Catenulispora pinistramenti]